MRGFSTIEIVFALAIMCMSISAVACVVFAGQENVMVARARTEAKTLAEETIHASEMTARKHFHDIGSFEEDRALYHIVHKSTLLSDFRTKKIEVAVSWRGEHSFTHEVTLNTVVTNFADPIRGETCDLDPHIPWSQANIVKTRSFMQEVQDVDAQYGQLIVKFKSSTSTTILSALTLNESEDAESVYTPNSLNLEHLNPPTIKDTFIYGNIAYLATTDKSNELWILDVHDPQNPVLIEKYNARGGFGAGKSVFVQDSIIYVGKAYENNKYNEFQIYSLDPDTGRIKDYLGGYKVGGSVIDILVRGGSAFIIASTTEQYKVLNVSDPTHVLERSSIALPEGSTTFDCEGNRLYVVSNKNGHGQISIIEPTYE